MNNCGIRWMAALVLVAAARGADPEVNPGEFVRFPALDAEAAAKSFVVREGFRAELAADEPHVASPVAMAFDEDGRQYVVEMRDYSEHREEKLGRIRRLEDTDGDGRFDRSVVFAEDLAWPTAVICHGGGIFVGATPDILFLRDTDGDGKADERRLIFTGFGSGQERLNVQQLMNSFTWGLDNRIHGATAGNGGTIQQVASGGAPARLGGRDFSFDPRTLSMRAETGGGQHGMSFDDFGRKFTCSNSSHIRMAVYEDRYLEGATGVLLPGGAIDIAKEGPAAEVYRLSPEEPWRTIRTRWRVSGATPGIIEGGGRASGYFTGATGVTIYRGDAYPAEFSNNAFVGDAGGNLAHRKILNPAGVVFEASRPADELNREFLASKDTWFRPVQFANGPDGCLYVIDMQREVIEHPWSIPPNLKKLIDLDSGRERGRIWRIVPAGFQRPPPTRLGKATAVELAEALRSGNGWRRDTAARLLQERNDRGAVPELERTISGPGASDAAVAQTLHALAGLKALKGAHIVASIRRPARGGEGLREVAIRLMETLPATDALVALEELGSGRNLGPRAAHQLAWTLGVLNPSDRLERLVELAGRPGDGGPWIEAAILVSAGKDSGRLFQRILEGTNAASHGSLLAQLAGAVPESDLQAALAKVARLEDRAAAFNLASAMIEANSRRGRATPPVARELFDEAAKAVDQAPGSLRSRAGLALLRFDATPGANAVLERAMRRGIEGEMEGAFRGLLRNPRGAAEELWGVWKKAPVASRARSLDLLLGRNEGPELVLGAIREGRIARLDLTAAQAQGLRQHSNPEISRPALALLGQAESDRAAVIEKLRPSLAMTGDMKRGEQIYNERCATCHRVAGRGVAVGPDLESVRGNGVEYMLTHLIDPNREVNARFLAYTAVAKDGESVTGVLVSETEGRVTLRMAGAVEKTIERGELQELAASPSSLMPVGLEEGLAAEDLAALIEFTTKAQAR